MNEIIPIDRIKGLIYLIRGEKVMLDRDIAALYGVETGQLKRAVRRNIERFPADFMFVLSEEEFDNLRCQIDTSSWGGTRYMPMAFTEQGVAMLSSVLRSERAVKMNIAIMRAFVALRKMIADYDNLEKRLEKLEREQGKIAGAVLSVIKQLEAPVLPGTKRIGFDAKAEKRKEK